MKTKVPTFYSTDLNENCSYLADRPKSATLTVETSDSSPIKILSVGN
jgi:hypothetical protein